jgi:uncharacterized protein
MISATQIKKIAAKHGINPGIIERDYVLSKVLFGLSIQQRFQENFVFKGGTALKKLFFPEWRYSEDLDFTLLEPMRPIAVKKVLTAAGSACRKEVGLDIQAQGLNWPSEGDQTFPGYIGLKLSYTGPLAKASGIKNVIKVDLTQDEPIVGERETKKMISVYPDDPDASIKSYSLEEIMAEKMRSILERGKSRDYYDVWQLLKLHSSGMSYPEILRIFMKKCTHKYVEFASPEDFLKEKRTELARSYWKRGLAHQMTDLPDFDVAMKELRDLLEELF